MPHISSRFERQFQKTLSKYGKYFLYLRKDPRIHCSCWNDDTKEGDPHHETCFGLGSPVRVERQLVLAQVAAPLILQQTAQLPTPLGLIENRGMLLFFQREVWPRPEDLVCEVEWDVSSEDVTSSGRLAHLLEIYIIQSLERISDEHGEIIAHRAAAHSRPAQFAWLESLLREIEFTWTPSPPEAGAAWEITNVDTPLQGMNPPSSGKYG